MEPGSTKAISAVKQEIRLREWSEQIERQQSSGLSVEQWCDENGINPKTYYYRLRKVRENVLRHSLPSYQSPCWMKAGRFESKRTE